MKAPYQYWESLLQFSHQQLIIPQQQRGGKL